jgi:S1-C subfamily serine protease
VDGKPTPNLFEYRMQTATIPPGAVASLSVVRDGRALAHAVRVAAEPVPTGQLAARHLGLEFVDVDEAVSREANIPLDAGVLVRAVRPGGPAARVRLKPNDLIVGLGTYKIRNSDDLLLFLQYVQPGDKVEVLIRRPMARSVEGRVLWEDKSGVLSAD